VGSSRENEVGIIVGCLSLNKAGLLLVVPLDTDDDDVARLPAPDADCIVVETSRVVGKINVENKPAAERPLLKDGFVLAAGASFFGLDAQGTHPLGSFRAPICSLARARRGEMFAATVDSKLVSFDPVHGKVKEVASLRLVAGSNDDSAPPPLFVRGLCFAEGKPAQMDSGKVRHRCMRARAKGLTPRAQRTKIVAGASQMQVPSSRTGPRRWTDAHACATYVGTVWARRRRRRVTAFARWLRHRASAKSWPSWAGATSSGSPSCRFEHRPMSRAMRGRSLALRTLTRTPCASLCGRCVFFRRRPEAPRTW